MKKTRLPEMAPDWLAVHPQCFVVILERRELNVSWKEKHTKYPFLPALGLPVVLASQAASDPRMPACWPPGLPWCTDSSPGWAGMWGTPLSPACRALSVPTFRPLPLREHLQPGRLHGKAGFFFSLSIDRKTHSWGQRLGFVWGLSKVMNGRIVGSYDFLP